MVEFSGTITAQKRDGMHSGKPSKRRVTLRNPEYPPLRLNIKAGVITKAIAGTSTEEPVCSEREKTVRVPRQGFRKTLRRAPTERPQGPLRRTSRPRYRPQQPRSDAAGEHGWNRENPRPRYGAIFIFLIPHPCTLPPSTEVNQEKGEGPGERDEEEGNHAAKTD
jgi:hypothetical protein